MLMMLCQRHTRQRLQLRLILVTPGYPVRDMSRMQWLAPAKAVQLVQPWP